MPFPFMPVGAFVAALFLGSVFALFIAAMHVIDRTVTDAGGAVVGRLVAGFDDWSHDRGDPRASRHGGEPMAMAIQRCWIRSSPRRPSPSNRPDRFAAEVSPARLMAGVSRTDQPD